MTDTTPLAPLIQGAGRLVAMSLIGAIHDAEPLSSVPLGFTLPWSVDIRVDQVTSAARWGTTEAADLGPEDF